MNTVPALHDHSSELDLLHGREPSLTEDGGFNEESFAYCTDGNVARGGFRQFSN